MNIRIITFLGALVLALGVQAQNTRSDAQVMGLKGNVKSLLTTSRNGSRSIVGQPIRYVFNDQGNYEHVHYFDTAGNLAITVHYKYDKRGNLVADNRLMEPFSQLSGVTNYSYDRKHRTLTAELLQMEDTTSFITVSTYDKQGREVETLLKWSNGDTVSRVTKEYDQWGNMVKITYFETKDNLYRGETVYRYDTDGNVVEENVRNMDRTRWALLYSYSFDEWGNWTKCYKFRATTHEASLFEVITREITYVE